VESYTSMAPKPWLNRRGCPGTPSKPIRCGCGRALDRRVASALISRSSENDWNAQDYDCCGFHRCRGFHGKRRPGEHEPGAARCGQQHRSGSWQPQVVRARPGRLASAQSVRRAPSVSRVARRRPPSRLVCEVRAGLVLRLLIGRSKHVSKSRSRDCGAGFLYACHFPARPPLSQRCERGSQSGADDKTYQYR